MVKYNHEMTIQKIQECTSERKLIRLLDDWYFAWNGNCPRITCHVYDSKSGERKYRVDNLFYEGDRKYYNLQGFKNALCRFIQMVVEQRAVGTPDPEAHYKEESRWIYLIFKETLRGDDEMKPKMENTLQGVKIFNAIRHQYNDIVDNNMLQNAEFLADELHSNVFKFVKEYDRFHNFHRQGDYNNIISAIKMIADKMRMDLPPVEINPTNISESYPAIWAAIYKQIPINTEEMGRMFTIIYDFFEEYGDIIDHDEASKIETFITTYINAEL